MLDAHYVVLEAVQDEYVHVTVEDNIIDLAFLMFILTLDRLSPEII